MKNESCFHDTQQGFIRTEETKAKVSCANYGQESWANRWALRADLDESRVEGETYLRGAGPPEGGGSHTEGVLGPDFVIS